MKLLKTLLITLFCAHAVHCASFVETLNQQLAQNGYTDIEGNMCSTSSDQPLFFKDLLTSNRSIRTIGEIGFNAGHSSLIFLETRPDVIVYSFDLMNHNYTPCAKAFIDQHFPNRHLLIEGDSTQSVPVFHANNPSLQFDLIFIDGGHAYDIALSDIQNMQKFAHKDTIVVLDDAFPGMEPDKASITCEQMGLIQRGKFYISAHDPKDWPKAWLVFNYVFKE